MDTNLSPYNSNIIGNTVSSFTAVFGIDDSVDRESKLGKLDVHKSLIPLRTVIVDNLKRLYKSYGVRVSERKPQFIPRMNVVGFLAILW